MNYQCEWLNAPQALHGNQCTNQGIYVILYGCLRLHTDEIIFCAQHTQNWEEMAATSKAYCPNNHCSQYVDTFTRINLENVTNQWLTHHHT